MTPPDPPPRRPVVGAALVRHGQVLAARRTAPAAAAGRWEFPGGKVEPGETPDAALVRELREELGCEVTVLDWLDWLGGAVPIGETHELRVAHVRLLDGEPRPTEHDAVCWLGPEELDRVDWLGPDRPFLPELRELLLDGEILAGGNVGGAVRIGDTVRRPTGPWTPAVHRLLRHLEKAGLDAVPAVHGRDARGREVLDHLPGDVIDVDTERLSCARLTALGRWTARLHAAVRDFADPGPWRFFGVAAPQIVAHNDLAPYNVCFVGDEVAGVFDWDLAGPSTPLLELAHLAWNGIPLFREIPDDEARARLRVLADAYGGPTAQQILEAVPARVRIAIDGVRAAAASGDEGMRRLADTGEADRNEARLASFRARFRLAP